MSDEALQILESGLNQIALSVPLEERELFNHKAPIYRLPNELLAEIWIHNCHRHTVIVAKRIYPFPLVVSWVTRHWRNVAINTPALWCGIDINLDDDDDDYGSHYSIKLTEEFISRSEMCLLDVSVRDHPMATLADKWDIVLPHVERWRSLEISDHYDVSRGSAELLVLGSLRGLCAPQLEHLVIRYNHTVGAHSALIFGKGTPALSEARIAGINFRLNLTILTGLKCLHLFNIPTVGRPTHTEFGNLLAASPCLTELFIGGVCLDYLSNPRSHYPTIRSDSLRKLFIGSEDANFIRLLFSVFLTPSLEYLFLEMKASLLMTFVDTLEIVSWPKYPLLSQLLLHGNYPLYPLARETLDGMLKLVRCSPSMEFLELGTSIANHVLSYVTNYEGEDAGMPGHALWPKLRTLHCPNYSWISSDVLCGFVIKRHSIGMHQEKPFLVWAS